MRESTVRAYSIHICDACFNLEGGECHQPGCVFCWRSTAEIGDVLDKILIRPVIDGERAAQPVARATMSIMKGFAELDRLLEHHGFGPCTHPDCDAGTGSCATNYFHRRARGLALAAIIIGRKLEKNVTGTKREAARKR